MAKVDTCTVLEARRPRRRLGAWGLAAALAGAMLAFAPLANAQEEAAASKSPVELAQELMTSPQVVANTLWIIVAALLVFWMNAGFGCLETGLCRRKNAVNIFSKNFIVFGISTIAFWCIGFGFMFGDGGGFIGKKGFFPSFTPFDPEVDLSPLGADEGYSGVFSALNWSAAPLSVKFFFQLVFAGTAATIVSGVVAERIKYLSFLLFSFFIVAFVYAIPGHWIWGGGWLADAGFWDFAGSTVVHSCGGWAALAGAIVLGPRLGKFRKGGGVNPIPGHNMALASIGCLILWLGWFGFNPGSTMTADPPAIGHIALTTNMAAAAGALAATATAWLLFKKPDLTMTLNGCLAGLVAITAPCAWVSVAGALLIGLCAGAIVVCGIILFDKLRIDDPVGALSVHLLCGIFGTLAVGLWALPGIDGGPAAGLFYGGGLTQLGAQALGVLSAGAYVFGASMAIWMALKLTIGVRVSAEEELEGLDLGEHGMEAYPGFAKEEGRDSFSTGSLSRDTVVRVASEMESSRRATSAV
jgi:Amt family ammonium transporter